MAPRVHPHPEARHKGDVPSREHSVDPATRKGDPFVAAPCICNNGWVTLGQDVLDAETGEETTEMTGECKLFTALVVFVGIIVVGTVGYDIYRHPAGPNPVGTSIIEIEGTKGIRFKGTVGTVREQHAIEASTPVTFKTPYTRADYIVANISPVEQGSRATLKAEIKKVMVNAKDKTVEKEQATGGGVFLMWEPPHSDGES